MFLSVYGISCSSSHDFAFLQEVQLGEVYKVTIGNSHSLRFTYILFASNEWHFPK